MAIQNIDEAVRHLLTYNAKTSLSRKYHYLYKNRWKIDYVYHYL